MNTRTTLIVNRPFKGNDLKIVLNFSDWRGGRDVPVVQPDCEGHLRRRRVRRAAPGGEEQGQEGIERARKGLNRVR